MPLYSYRCEKGHEFDRFLKLDDYQTPQTCECGAQSKKLIKPTQINCDIQPWDAYISPTTGKLITSYKQRREDMKASGCVDYEPSMLKHRDKQIAEEERKLDKAVDDTVDEFFEKAPAKKREKLINEIEHCDLDYKRI